MQKITKVMLVFGTRPEAIKMSSLVKQFKQFPDVFETKVCVTAQHRHMLDQVLEFFEITPDYDLDIMKDNQDLFDITANILVNMREVLNSFSPDFIFVHGDTTTTLSASLAGYYSKVKVCHVEAGLRTGNIYSPWPEEINRRLTGQLAAYHFAPTESSRENLIKENIPSESILVTGNTVIDSLLFAFEKISSNKKVKADIVENLSKFVSLDNRKIVLVTGHRRENFGDGFRNICNGLKEIAEKKPDIHIIYPVHLNPNVRKPVFELLSEVQNISLIEPLPYLDFVYMMSISYLIITDSGGIQEEAPSLGKPVIVTRDTTERPEAVVAGTVKLVGTDKNELVSSCLQLIDDEGKYSKMSCTANPYGDGRAAERIVNFIKGL